VVQDLQDLGVAVHRVGSESFASAGQYELLEVGPPKIGGGRDPSAPVGEAPGAVGVPLDSSPAQVSGLAVREELLGRSSSVSAPWRVVVQVVGPCRSSSLSERTATEDFSSLLTGRQKTCLVPGGGNTERLV
jgi:hypothetical protein